MIRGYFKLEFQKNNAQEKISALIEAGAISRNIFFEAGGFKELNRLLRSLRKGDMFMVTQVADICRNKSEFSKLIGKLEKKTVSFRSLDEPWLDLNALNPENTTTKTRRTTAEIKPLSEQPSNSKSVGRPKGPRRDIVQKLNLAFRMYHTADHLSVSDICKTTKLNERTFYRHLERQEVQITRRPKGRKSKPLKA